MSLLPPLLHPLRNHTALRYCSFAIYLVLQLNLFPCPSAEATQQSLNPASVLLPASSKFVPKLLSLVGEMKITSWAARPSVHPCLWHVLGPQGSREISPFLVSARQSTSLCLHLLLEALKPLSLKTKSSWNPTFACLTLCSLPESTVCTPYLTFSRVNALQSGF